MKRLLLLPSALVILAGCQSADAPPADAVHAEVATKTVMVGAPSNTEPTKIGLVVRRGPAITVGYPSPDKLLELFHDPKHSGSEFNDLPTSFDYHYRARTWETAHMGFGEITYDGILVAAMYQEDKVDQDRVDEIVAAHKEQVDLLPTNINGRKVSYWFWEIANQRLMICSNHTGRQGIKLTVAMGDDKVLDALGISLSMANRDMAIVDKASSAEKGPLARPIVPGK